MKSDLPSPEILRKMLRYDPESGKLFWLPRGPNLARRPETFNTQFAWREAGSVNKRGYRVTKIFGKVYRAHRLAWAIYHGVWPDGDLDHRDGVRDNNRISNLRPATNKENQKNAKLRSISTSGICGVSWITKDQRWRAQIGVDNRIVYLGQFRELSVATAVRKEAETLLMFSERHGT